MENDQTLDNIKSTPLIYNQYKVEDYGIFWMISPLTPAEEIASEYVPQNHRELRRVR